MKLIAMIKTVVTIIIMVRTKTAITMKYLDMIKMVVTTRMKLMLPVPVVLTPATKLAGKKHTKNMVNMSAMWEMAGRERLRLRSIVTVWRFSWNIRLL